MSSPIVLRKAEGKIEIENRCGVLIAAVTKFDTEFFEPVIESELTAICKVVRDFEMFLEIIGR